MNTDGHTAPRTGNSFIDVTHEALMDRVGIIRRACASGSPREAVVPHFSAFLDEMHEHFDHEEVIIRAVGFRRWEEHAQQHASLGQQIVRLVDYVRDCEVSNDFLCTVAGTLDAALCRHEIGHDVEYATLLRDAAHSGGGGALIVWEPDFDLGIAPLDAQHRQLVDCLNEVHRITAGGGTDAEAIATLEAMHDHVHAHFAMEEGILRSRCPGRFVAHRAHHATLDAQLTRVRRAVETGRVDIGVVTRDFLRFWLLDHLLGADRAALGGTAAA